MKRYSDESKKLMLNVVNYFENELGSRFKAIQKAAEALKVAQSTIYKLEKPNRSTDSEFKSNLSVNISNGKNKLQKVFLHSIREAIYKMYARKENISIETVYQQLKEEMPDMEFSKSSLYLGMKKMGFNFKKHDGRKHLMELPDVRIKRLHFLHKYQAAKKDTLFTPVYLDETWVFSKGGDRRMWQDDSKVMDYKKTGCGERYVIVHAGNSEGFIQNASLIFKCKKKTGDYHDNMNNDNFENWFKTQLIPNLEEPSLIVMDNASYHSRLEEKIPRKSWTKDRLINWLQNKNVTVPKDVFKDSVWSLVQKQKKSDKICYTDKFAESYGHRVLRLPPYHCHFNPIEMIWSECKRRYDQNVFNRKASPDEILKMWNNVVENIPPSHWKNSVDHTEKIISEAWATENKMDILNIEPMVINVSQYDDDDDSLFSESDMDGEEMD